MVTHRWHCVHVHVQLALALQDALWKVVRKSEGGFLLCSSDVFQQCGLQASGKERPVWGRTRNAVIDVRAADKVRLANLRTSEKWKPGLGLACWYWKWKGNCPPGMRLLSYFKDFPYVPDLKRADEMQHAYRREVAQLKCSVQMRRMFTTLTVREWDHEGLDQRCRIAAHTGHSRAWHNNPVCSAAATGTTSTSYSSVRL